MHPLEMGNGSIRNEADENNPYGGRPSNNDTLFLFERIRGDKLASNAEKFARSNTYSKLFKAAFGDSVIKLSRIALALSAFERTMISKSSPFDEFNNGRLNAINPSAKRGYKLFIDKDRANCISCHNGINFTDNEQRNNGLQYTDKDRGLQDFTKKASDAGLFKTPTLRNVALTAPYMHDGRLSDLRAVIEHYSKGGDNVSYKDSKIKPLNLTEQEKIDLEEFLKSLTDLNFASNPSFKDPRSW
jgi:cytochrome c peroxidase